MQGNEVGLLQQLVKRNRHAAERFNAFFCAVRIIRENRRAEALEPRGNLSADVAEADQTDLQVAHVVGIGAVGVFLCPAAGLDIFVRSCNIPDLAEHCGNRKVCNRNSCATRRVDHLDAAFLCSLHVDVFHAGAECRNNLQVLCRLDHAAADRCKVCDDDFCAVQILEDLFVDGCAVGPVDLDGKHGILVSQLVFVDGFFNQRQLVSVLFQDIKALHQIFVNASVINCNNSLCHVISPLFAPGYLLKSSQPFI